MKKQRERISTLLVDGDILVYKIGYISDAEAKYKHPESWQGENYLPLVLWHIDKVVDGLKEQFPNATECIIYLSGPKNFRKEVATLKPYKGNRTQEKPKYYLEIRDYLVKTYGAIVADNEEADDLMGIAQFAKPDKSTVICSIDKDLDMIPGLHYNDKKDRLYEINLGQAERFYHLQLLTGDATDNIPGVPGIGPKTAEKIIGDKAGIDAFQAIQEEYKKYYGASAESAFEENSRLLWIRRTKDQSPPYISARKVSVDVPQQVEDKDADGQLHSTLGIREESTDVVTGAEDRVPVRSGEDQLYGTDEGTHIYA
jgi:5'-3' exonuclease